MEIAASEQPVELAADGFDAGIRLGQFIAADMVAVRLTPPFPFAVVGSPDYLRLRKPPERIDDLRQHACLRMRRSDGSIAPWPFVDGNKTVEAIVSGPLIARDYSTLLGAAIQGVGLAQVPHPIARAALADGRLQVLLTPFAVTLPGVFLYHPGRRQVLPKLRAFIEHVKYKAARLHAAEQLHGARVSMMVQTALDDPLEESVIQIVDLKAEFAKLRMLQGRTPTSSDAEREGAFGRVAPYRDGAIFTAKFAGTSAWERHPQGDEIVQIVDGATTLHLMTEQGRQSVG